MNTVELRGVCRTYQTAAEQVHALVDVDLTLAAGTMACVYGPSGSGKTTLVNMVAGLDGPDSGSVQVAGARLDELGEKQRAHHRLERISVIFQDDNLIPELTAVENIVLPLVALGVGRRDAERQAREALERVQIGSLGDRLPADMSGGQRQRVGIARAFTGERSILVADEPTGAVDSTTAEALFSLMRELAEQGSTVLVSTHDPLGARHAHQVFTMLDGHLSHRPQEGNLA